MHSLEEMTRRKVCLKDYRPPAFLIPDLTLQVEIYHTQVLVHAELLVERNSGVPDDAPLVLDGENLTLLALRRDEALLAPGDYTLTDRSLTLRGMPQRCHIQTTTSVDPYHNRSGIGLYCSGAALCSQMEAEGFRRLTYFIDRPDIMTRTTCRISADKNRHPVLLANGNCIKKGEEQDGRHYAVWQDPHPKPCYLFALVAGDLAVVSDSFSTKSGRKVSLHFYVPHGTEHQCGHAIASLKKAMRWDEQVFGLEYDLDEYSIVAVHDFNFGAMENKGLNIFNSAYVLADPLSATDQDFVSIESVIAHEYFHNWTGNRVTLRDWCQLTLKEGLTVYRDQEFTADMQSRAVKRIADASLIKTVQFTEDAGPNAHPIRPDSYLEINNFYTSTVYSKGAEVIRMIATLVGRETFLAGIGKYIELYDGKAVTVEHFVHAMHLASGFDFSQFMNWYTQAGTPVLQLAGSYAAERGEYRLSVRQESPTAPANNPFCIPLRVGLLDRQGRELPLRLNEGQRSGGNEAPKELVLQITEEAQSFTFTGITAPPVPSLLRQFSAPVRLEYNYDTADLALLLRHDPDSYCRYDAAQRLALHGLKQLALSFHTGAPPHWEGQDLLPYAELLQDVALDPAFLAELLSPPSVSTIVDLLEQADYYAAQAARNEYLRALGMQHKSVLLDAYLGLQGNESGELNREAAGRRRLKNVCLEYLVSCGQEDTLQIAVEQFNSARTMTDEYASFRLLCDRTNKHKDEAVERFYGRWRNSPLVMDKWLQAQAAAQEGALEAVQKLSQHHVFDPYNPNKLRALYRSFAGNYLNFHRADGSGYALIADKVLAIDSYNPNIAAGLTKAFQKYKRLDPQRQLLMRRELERIRGSQISSGVYEIVQQTLGGGHS